MTMNIFSSLMFRRLAMLISLSFLFVFLPGCGGGGGGGGSPSTEAGVFQSGEAKYVAGEYALAITILKQQLIDYPTGSLADDARYFLGKAYYGLGEDLTKSNIYDNYVTARGYFTEVLAVIPASNRADSAQYWLAKAYHAETNFDQARTEYNKVNAAGIFADNAAYQIGRTFYDEAGLMTLPTDALAKLDTAITQFQTVTAANYPASTYIDDAKFYMGRSYYEQAKLVQADNTISVIASTVYFDNARTAYMSIDPASTLADDAQYFIGRSYQATIPIDFALAQAAYDALVAMTNSTLSDDAKYQLGNLKYDEASAQTDPALAMPIYDAAIAHFNEINQLSANAIYATSNRLDSAFYYKGRSLHQQALLLEADATLRPSTTASALYTDARLAYNESKIADPTSGWADNALYQIGATYYDESIAAEGTSDFVTMQEKLSAAITAFDLVLSDPLYQISNSADNAYYQKARSFHRVLALPVIDRINVSNGTDFTVVTLADVRSKYQALLALYEANDPNFTSSAWIDNAYYYLGVAYYEEAKIEAAAIPPTALILETAYNGALAEFDKIVTTFASGIYLDNAAQQIALIYHDTCQLTNEKDWWNYLVNILGVGGAIGNEASIHLDDLNLAPPVDHTCTPTLMNINITHTAPLP